MELPAIDADDLASCPEVFKAVRRQVRLALARLPGNDGLVAACARLRAVGRALPAEKEWAIVATRLPPEARGAMLEVVEDMVGAGNPSLSAVRVGARQYWLRCDRIAASPSHPASLGNLVTLFESESARDLAQESVVSVVADLLMSARVARRVVDGNTVTALAAVLARADERTAEPTFRSALEIVRNRTRSDGARIYLLRRNAEGPSLQRFKLEFGEFNSSPPQPLRHNKGLANWVMMNRDWLHVTKFASPAEMETGAHGLVEWQPIPDSELDPTQPALDPERSLLMVPIVVGTEIVGAVSVWRGSDEPYDVVLDVESLTLAAVPLATSCEWHVSASSSHEEINERSGLSTATMRRAALAEVLTIVAAGAGRLAHAARSLLFLRDHRRRSAFFTVAQWTHPDLADATLSAQLPLLVDCSDRDGEPAQDQLARAVMSAPRLAAISNRRLGVWRVIPFPIERDQDAWKGCDGAVVLLDVEPDDAGSVIPGDSVEARTVKSFLNRAHGLVLTSYVDGLANRVAQELLEPDARDAGSHEHASSEAVLRAAADVLKACTRTDAVLVYHAAGSRMTVRHAVPALSDGEPLGVNHDTLTASLVKARQSCLILDVNDERDALTMKLNRPELERIRKALGWEGIQSWLFLPVVQGERVVGALKLLTRRGAPCLSHADHRLAEAVAARAGVEMTRLGRGPRRDALNDLQAKLGGLEGAVLFGQMREGLQAWSQAFIAGDCSVAVTADLEDAGPRVVAVSPRLAHLSGSLQAVSERLGSVDRRFNRPKDLPAAEGEKWPGDQCLLAAGVSVSGPSRLTGHIIACSGSTFDDEAAMALREAAREMALLIDREKQRQKWRYEVGMFRHAIIGPMQGMYSAARKLKRVAEAASAPSEEIRKWADHVEREAQSVRLWRENQRLYMRSAVDVKPQRRALRPIVDLNVSRFEAAMRSRRLWLRLMWRPPGHVIFPFDEQAIDVVLANLLDNAIKYSFAARGVVLGVDTDRTNVRIWVEDEGHGIPEHFGDRIYDVGRRLDQRDPVRTIDGMGLGLPMVKAIVTAHGGEVFHSSEALEERGLHEVDPHRVRFELRLPHGWTRA